METIFDWVTLGIFAGLIVLFMERSSEDVPRDQLSQYLFPSVGCAVANYLGNEGLKDGGMLYLAAAALVIAGVVGYILKVLKPFERGPKSGK